jgi:hypothetical protein
VLQAAWSDGSRRSCCKFIHSGGLAPGPIYQLGVADATALSATRSMRVMACLRQLRTDLQESAWKAIHEVGDL